jgi:hypothetical protein
MAYYNYVDQRTQVESESNCKVQIPAHTLLLMEVDMTKNVIIHEITHGNFTDEELDEIITAAENAQGLKH